MSASTTRNERYSGEKSVSAKEGANMTKEWQSICQKMVFAVSGKGKKHERTRSKARSGETKTDPRSSGNPDGYRKSEGIRGREVS